MGESIEGLVDAIRSEGWVDDALAGVGLALEVASTVIDPFSALLANGLGWAMEYFAPLREILDQLAGMPDVVASHAATWDNIAAEAQAMAEDLKGYLARDLPEWRGSASDSYQNLMTHNVNALAGSAGIAAAMGAATRSAGNLVQLTRDIVRDLIADLVARCIVWAVEAIFVVTIPVVAAQIVAAVLKWTGRILTYVSGLINSLTNLTKLVNG